MTAHSRAGAAAMKPRFAALAALLMLITASGTGLAQGREGVDAAAVFARLSSLSGSWQGVYASGRKHRVDYRLTAAGTAIVETWALAPGRESLTIYHLDGERLLATHYCPQGNAPRLVLTSQLADGSYHFSFDGGTNLNVSGASHQHSLNLHLIDDGAFERSEHYVENGTDPRPAGEPDELVRYRRLAQGTAHYTYEGLNP